MRRYTLVFMEQKIGVPRLTPVPGEDGAVSFEAADDDAARDYVHERFTQRVRGCVRAELSSMAIVENSSGHGTRFVDDSLKNPHFQESYIRYDASTHQLEVAFESTATSLAPDLYRRALK